VIWSQIDSVECRLMRFWTSELNSRSMFAMTMIAISGTAVSVTMISDRLNNNRCVAATRVAVESIQEVHDIVGLSRGGCRK